MFLHVDEPESISVRVMVNPFWINSIFDGLFDFVAPWCISDQTLSIISLLEPPRAKNKPALSKKFLDIVADNWVFRGYDSAQFCLKQKLKGLNTPLEFLNVAQFGNISSRAKDAKNRLEDMQNRILQSGIMCGGSIWK